MEVKGNVKVKRSNDLLLEEVLPVAEGAELRLLLLVLQFLLWRMEVEDEVLKGEDDALQRKRHGPWRLALPTQRVQTSERIQVNNTCYIYQ